MTDLPGWRRALRTAPIAIGVYFAVSAAWVVGDRALLDRAHPTAAGWLLAKVALPCAITLAVLGLAFAAGLGRRTLGLCAAPARFWAIALVAGAAPVLVVVWHGATQGFAVLASAHAAKLAGRIALDQAWLEELLARGLLLALLLGRAASRRRAVWLDAICFGAMHVLQFLWPPVTAAGIANGLVLVAIATPTGYALARLTVAARSVLPAMLLHLLLDLTILPQVLMHANVGLILAASAATIAVVLVAPGVRAGLRTE